ncbi:MAG: polysaccharide biosynthesis tyrosine autokinase [Acidimicrobiales bacterium]
MAANGGTKGQDLAGYLSILRHRWRWLAVPIILMPLLAIYYTTRQAPVYQSEARVLLDTSAAQDAVASRLNLPTAVEDRDLVNEANVADSDAVRGLVRQGLDIPGGEPLPKGQITADLESDVISFRFSGGSPQEAALIANTWADAYVDFKRESAQSSIDDVLVTLDAELEQLREQRSALRADLEQLENRLVAERDPEARDVLQLRVARETSAISGDLALIDAQIATAVNDIGQLRLSRELAGSATVVQEAALPREQANGQVSRNVAIGLVLGALLGLTLALIADTLDKSIRTTGDLERIGLGVKSLGRIPAVPRGLVRGELGTIAHTRPSSKYADGYHKVRTALDFLTLDQDVTSILITSPAEGDGKSTLASNLALAYANAENNVVLIDADLRHPKLPEILSTQPSPGLADLSPERSSLAQVAVGVPHLTPRLWVVPAGDRPPNNLAAFLTSTLVSSAIKSIGDRADIVLIDAPPVLPVADALSLAPIVDGVILLVTVGSTTEAEVAEAMANLRGAGANVLGVVLNRAKVAASSRYHRNERVGSPMIGSQVDDPPPPSTESAAPAAAATTDTKSAEANGTDDPDDVTATIDASEDLVKEIAKIAENGHAGYTNGSRADGAGRSTDETPNGSARRDAEPTESADAAATVVVNDGVDVTTQLTSAEAAKSADSGDEATATNGTVSDQDQEDLLLLLDELLDEEP